MMKISTCRPAILCVTLLLFTNLGASCSPAEKSTRTLKKPKRSEDVIKDTARTDQRIVLKTKSVSSLQSANKTNSEKSESDEKAVLTCESSDDGIVEERFRYEKAFVIAPSSCRKQLQKRSCNNGKFSEWSGVYIYEQCEIRETPPAYADCDYGRHGDMQSRLRFLEQNPTPSSDCQQEVQTRTCYDGVWSSWSGSFRASQCSPSRNGFCGSTANGNYELRERFRSALVAHGQACESEQQTRQCVDGQFSEWTGSFTANNCQVSPPAPCGNVAHGTIVARQRYQNSSVPYGESCRSEEQTQQCSNGNFSAWTGSFTYESCAVEDPQDCGSTAHGDFATRLRFRSDWVPHGEACQSEEQKRVCNNGRWLSWSGQHEYDSCRIADPFDCHSRRIQPPQGYPDTTFEIDSNVKLRADFVDAEGRLYFYGQTNSDDPEILVRRYLPNKEIDLSFGNQGTFQMNVAPNFDETISHINTDPIGRLVLTGYRTRQHPRDATIDTDRVLMIVRLTSSGKLDTTFNPDGKTYGALTVPASAPGYALYLPVEYFEGVNFDRVTVIHKPHFDRFGYIYFIVHVDTFFARSDSARLVFGHPNGEDFGNIPIGTGMDIAVDDSCRVFVMGTKFNSRYSDNFYLESTSARFVRIGNQLVRDSSYTHQLDPKTLVNTFGVEADGSIIFNERSSRQVIMRRVFADGTVDQQFEMDFSPYFNDPDVQTPAWSFLSHWKYYTEASGKIRVNITKSTHALSNQRIMQRTLDIRLTSQKVIDTTFGNDGFIIRNGYFDLTLSEIKATLLNSSGSSTITQKR